MNYSHTIGTGLLVLGLFSLHFGCSRSQAPADRQAAEAAAGQLATVTLFVPGMNQQLQIL